MFVKLNRWSGAHIWVHPDWESASRGCINLIHIMSCFPKVKSPSQFTARVVLPWEQDAFEKASHQWQDQIQILADRAVINDEIHMVCSSWFGERGKGLNTFVFSIHFLFTLIVFEQAHTGFLFFSLRGESHKSFNTDKSVEKAEI